MRVHARSAKQTRKSILGLTIAQASRPLRSFAEHP